MTRPLGTQKSWGIFLWKWIRYINHAKHFLWRSNRPINLYTDIKKHPLGACVGARVAPGVANIPITGLVKMFSGNQGAEIGGGMVEDLSKKTLSCKINRFC
tara:strand:+ start:1235 stop:1537 length:303 start_codon:yes stop_codon:yes gene_type:complete